MERRNQINLGNSHIQLWTGSIFLFRYGRVQTDVFPNPSTPDSISMKYVSLFLIPASLAGVAFGLMHYPLNPFWLGFILIGYACLLWVKPKSWLFVIPAIVPIADLSPWSGWLFFEELDLFILVTLAVGYWKLWRNPVTLHLPTPVSVILGVFALSCAISAWRGLMPLQPVDANAFSNYFSHYNSLRILKPLVWALLLLPLLKRNVDGDSIERLLIPGILTGLALVSLVTLWERLAFTGLMDFSSDYRITATFPEMHTGGAALDAYLAMTIPFSLLWIFRGKVFHISIAAIVLLAAATYAALVTFSRGLYMAFAVAMTVMLMSVMFGSWQRRNPRRLLPLAVILAIFVVLLVNVFSSGGYRGLFVAVLLIWTAIFVGGLAEPLPYKLGITALVALFVPLSFIMLEAFAKGAYLTFGLALFVFLAGFFVHTFAGGRMGRVGAMLAAAGFFAMVASGLMVNWHWGGQAALVSGAFVSVLALALVSVNLLVNRHLWQWNRSNALLVSFFLLMVSLVIPVIGNYYIEERFSQVKTDFQVRIDHWSETLEMMDTDWGTLVFGMGLGTFPETNFWKSTEQPGTFRFGKDEGGAYLRLTGSQPGWRGNFLRYGQRLDIQPFRPYLLELDARSSTPNERLLSGLCEKWLLYDRQCVQNTATLKTDGAWHHYTLPLNSGGIGTEPWYERPTAQFFLANSSAGGFLDLKNVALSDGEGNIIHNGNFSHGYDRWFFSSDHYHLPWHEKNLLLHVYFDQGMLGLGAFLLLVFYAMVKLASGIGRNGLFPAAGLAALAGFMVVGVFDSVLDFPRLALMFYLLLFCSLLDISASSSQFRSGGTRISGRKSSG